MKILNVVETAYRATLEEQDDPVLWLSRAIVNAGAKLSLLLRGNAVNYLVRQECPALTIGNARINHPASPNEDLARLLEKGTVVYAVREDVEDCGIDFRNCIAGIEIIRVNEIATMMDAHDQVWYW
jgi:hypothetical protein